MARVCVDSTFFSIDASGNLTFKRTSVGLQAPITLINSNGTFTKASFPGLTRIRVRAVGGGGGAGGSAGVSPSGSTCGAGGGGGGYSESVISASSLSASETVTIGAGGAGGLGANPGANGGATTFGSFITAQGGLGSPAAVTNVPTGAATAQGGFGAPAGLGQITVPGGNSANGVAMNNNVAVGGGGGDAGGGYGFGGAPGSSSSGTNGSGYGGGGGGVSTIFGPATANGGDGANGVVFIELFF